MSVTVQNPSAVINNPVGSSIYARGGSGAVSYVTSTINSQPFIVETSGFIAYSSKVAEAIETLSQEVSELKAAIESLTALVAEKDRVKGPSSTHRRKSLRGQQSDENTKKLIKDMFEKRHGETIFPSDIADELQIDYDRAVRLIRDLENDGKIAKV